MAPEGGETSPLLLNPRMEGDPALEQIGGGEYLVSLYATDPPPVVFARRCVTSAPHVQTKRFAGVDLNCESKVSYVPLRSEHRRGLMRCTLIGLIAAAALGSVGPAAFAADMAPPPEPAPVSSWTGFYLGAGGGVGWADIDINHRRCALDWDGTCDPDWDFHHDFNENGNGNIIGIVQGGFDWEIANAFVVGIGADWTFGDVLNNDSKHSDDNFGFHDHFQTDGSSMVDAYGRAGFAPTPN